MWVPLPVHGWINDWFPPETARSRNGKPWTFWSAGMPEPGSGTSFFSTTWWDVFPKKTWRCLKISSMHCVNKCIWVYIYIYVYIIIYIYIWYIRYELCYVRVLELSVVTTVSYVAGSKVGTFRIEGVRNKHHVLMVSKASDSQGLSWIHAT